MIKNDRNYEAGNDGIANVEKVEIPGRVEENRDPECEIAYMDALIQLLRL